MYSYAIKNGTIEIKRPGETCEMTLEEAQETLKEARELVATLKAAIAEIEKPAESAEEANKIPGVEFLQVSTLRGIKSPYNAEFVSALKAGIPSAKWNSTKRVWTFSPVDEQKVREIAMKFFGGETKRVRVTVEYNSARAGYTAPMIDGSAIIEMSRDAWKWHTSTTQKYAVSVIEENLSAGGSRKYPQLSGKITFEATVREGAIIDAGSGKLSVENL